MNMKLRPYKAEDSQIICSWIKAINNPPDSDQITFIGFVICWLIIVLY